MKEAHEYAEAMKVHMIGVGITGMNVDHMFKDHINVKGSDAYEPVIKRLAKLVAQEAGHATAFKRSA
jgi:UDP-N-acetylmuramate-alanine ligase